MSIMMFKIRRARKRDDAFGITKGGVTSQQSKQVERPRIDGGEKGGGERKGRKQSNYN